MHLGLNWRALCVPSRFMEALLLYWVPDGPQTYTLKVLWLQERAQICKSEWSQNITLTKNVGRCFILCSTFPTQSDGPIRWRCLLRVLCPVRRPVKALDCVLLKDRNLALAPRQGPEINSRACLWVSQRLRLLTDYDTNSITMHPVLNVTFLPFRTQTFISASHLTPKVSVAPLLITPEGPHLRPISHL